MWPRLVEVLLGGWLQASPWVFGHAGERWAWQMNDLVCGAAVLLLAVLSFAKPLRSIHLAELAVGLWLVGFGYALGSHPNHPALQNDILVGLTILMFALIPSEAGKPPLAWRRYLREEA